MVFGFVVRPVMLAAGGLFVILVLMLQILIGLRKIRFKGRLHMKVHKYGAWVLLGLASIHGLIGLIYVMGWRIG